MIPHSRPTLPEASEWEAVTSRLAPGWAADGPCVTRFAQAAAHCLGGAGGVAVNSGTSALHLALLAAGVRPGSEVLIPAYCCAALLNAVCQSGGIPVLVDAEPQGFQIDAAAAAHAITPRTAAIVVAHLFGHTMELDPFMALGVPVIEDCAQSFGVLASASTQRPVLSIASFYATKVITTGHGGLVSSPDSDVLERLHSLVEYDQCDYWEPRFSYRMGELPAALGAWQLGRLASWLHRRRVLADYYDRQLIPEGFQLPVGAKRLSNDSVGRSDGPRPLEPNFFRYVLRTSNAGAVMERLRAAGVDAKRPVYRPLHHYLGGEFPQAQLAHEGIVSVPIYPTLLDEEAERVVTALRSLPADLRG